MVRKPNSPKRTARAFGLALVASVLLSGLAAGSASATVQQWYSCKEVAASSGAYTDSACQTEGKGNFEWTKLSSTPVTLGLTGTTSFNLSGQIAFTKINISCSSAQATATIANPVGGGAGTFSTGAGSSLSLTGCTVTTPEGCKIEGGAINFNALKGEATEFNGGSAVKIEPQEGTTLAKLKIQSCSLQGTSSVGGSIYATVNPATSSLDFTEAGSVSTKLNGAKATLTGTGTIKTAASEALRLGVAPPVNTALPTVSPANPAVGTSLSASNGSWAHEPTSYSYQWSRCSLAGTECKEIASATKSTYTAGEFDEGHTMMVRVMATNSGGSKSASSAPSGAVDSNPTGTHHWYACREVTPGTGNYEDSACLNQSNLKKGNYDWVQLVAGTPTSFTSSILTPVKVSYEILKSKATIECTSDSGTGTVINPVGGGAGTLSANSDLMSLHKCKFTYPTSCSLKEESLAGASVNGSTTERKIALTGGAGTLFSLWTEGTCLYLTPGGAPYPVSGTLNGVVNSVYSSLEFDSSSGSGLKCCGATWYYEGSIQLKTATGGLLRFKP